MNPSDANLALIRVVALRLGELRSRVVFLGGATISLLITDPASAYIRATDDVDIIIEISSYSDNDFMDAISCHLLGDDISQSRAIIIERRLNQIATTE